MEGHTSIITVCVSVSQNMKSKIYSSDDDSNEIIIFLCYIVFLDAGRIYFNTLKLITITINKKADIRTQNRDHVYIPSYPITVFTAYAGRSSSGYNRLNFHGGTSISQISRSDVFTDIKEWSGVFGFISEERGFDEGAGGKRLK